ncbi:MAG: Secreted protein [Jatrophihabitans sp.]|jgi:hypothetical protein|nr:Secreted protein [Jatrophihabitans sp.]
MTATATGGARVLRRVAIGLVILVVLLVVADRVGNYVAERTAGNTIQQSQHLTSRPDVNIGGFPFLTQLAAGHFDKITVTASHVPVGSASVPLQVAQVHVEFDGVTVSRAFSSVHANTANAIALVNYADLSKTLGVDLAYAGNGRIKASKSVSLAGRTLSAEVTTQPILANGALSFGSTQINGAGQLSGEVTALLNKVFDVSVPLQGIPFQIQVKSLTVDERGLHINLTGANLSYAN